MRTSLLAALPVLASIACANSQADSDTDPSVQNRAPEGGAVEIAATPSSQDLIATITAESTDPDGDAVTYTFAWTRDGDPMAALDSDTVPAAETAKGQVWAVQVTPTDGELDGAPFTAQVTVLNSAPTITAVEVSPAEVFTNTVLSADPTGDDVDGDTLTWTYAWTVDGQAAGDTATLDGATAFSRGQDIRLTVVANDGELDSEPWVSEPITVLNTPPTAPEVAFEPDPPLITSDLVCDVVVPSVDADGDALTYAFAFEVDGVAYSGETLTTHHSNDTIPAEQLLSDQEWTCSVTAFDGADVGPAGVATSEPTIARCGPLMHVDPEQVVDDWTLCYVAGSDSSEIRDMQCNELVAHLDAPVYGCWHGHSTYPHENNNNMLENACRAGVQHTTRYSSWSGNDHILTVCIQD